ncbi:MAG TPA: hypothetical protein VJ302_37590, partial [Blastocatellia bacterium]|nr:hypothetical protein [Blastocatellia bacterium]
MLEKHLGRESALAATRNLATRDIITECSDHGELIFRFQIPLSQMWVRRVKPSARVLLEEGKV